jgi:hypothetical protein
VDKIHEEYLRASNKGVMIFTTIGYSLMALLIALEGGGTFLALVTWFGGITISVITWFAVNKEVERNTKRKLR